MSGERLAFNWSRVGPWFLFLLLVAMLAFWPSYLSVVSRQSLFTHVHAVTATLWLLLLVAQPMALHAGRRSLHRRLGRTAFLVGPLVIVSVVLLAHENMQGLEGRRYDIQTYVLYLQVSLVLLFAVCYALAIAYRRRMALHARFMICTALTLIDPIVIRLLLWIAPVPAWNYQWLTFGLTDVLFAILIWLDRGANTGRWVFPAMLGLFVLLQLPALLGLTATPAWQSFATWFASLPLT